MRRVLFLLSGLVGLLAGNTERMALAFAPSPQHNNLAVASITRSPRTIPSKVTDRLFMSDVPRQEEPDEKNQQKQQRKAKQQLPPLAADKWWKPPPKPEDQLVMVGDLLALTIYGISDHLICQTMSNIAVVEAAGNPVKLQALATSLSGSEAATIPPVWLEPNSAAALHVLQGTLSSQWVTHYYSPLLDPMGTATCLLAGAWLLAGWWHRAFLFRNTTQCRTDKALVVTGQTWLTTAALVVAATTAVTHGLHVLHPELMQDATWSSAASGGGGFIPLTRGDLDYILGSLSVLALWRFMISFLLGDGSEEDS